MIKKNTEKKSGAVMDYPEHEITYKRFLALIKWSIVVVTIILIGMALFL